MRHKLLVVDDEEVIVFALKDYFSNSGCEVDTAMEFEEAQALLATGTYDLLIVDLRLGGSTGQEGLEIIRLLRYHCSHARVILLTAFGTPDVQRRAAQYGADCVMSKPVALPEIERTVRSLLEATA